LYFWHGDAATFNFCDTLNQNLKQNLGELWIFFTYFTIFLRKIILICGYFSWQRLLISEFARFVVMLNSGPKYLKMVELVLVRTTRMSFHLLVENAKMPLPMFSKKWHMHQLQVIMVLVWVVGNKMPHASLMQRQGRSLFWKKKYARNDTLWQTKRRFRVHLFPSVVYDIPHLTD
jgi:hypothetical protein